MWRTYNRICFQPLDLSQNGSAAAEPTGKAVGQRLCARAPQCLCAKGQACWTLLLTSGLKSFLLLPLLGRSTPIFCIWESFVCGLTIAFFWSVLTARFLKVIELGLCVCGGGVAAALGWEGTNMGRKQHIKTYYFNSTNVTEQPLYVRHFLGSKNKRSK